MGVLAVGRILRYSGLAYLGVKLRTVANSKAWVKAHTWQMVIFAVGIFLFFYVAGALFGPGSSAAVVRGWPSLIDPR